MTDPLPIELPISDISGMSAGQSGTIYRTPFVEHTSKIHRLGSGTVRRLFTGVGLWYWGTTPYGDWSGTTQTINEDGDMGSGGPAACPFSGTGNNTIMAAGQCRHSTGDAGYTTTRIPLNRNFRANISSDAELSQWQYKISLRKKTAAVIAWDSGAGAGSKIAANISGDPVIPDCVYTARTPTAQSIIIEAPSGENFNNYTFTGDDWMAVRKVDTVSGVRGRPGWYRIKAKPSSTTVELTSDAYVIHESDTLIDCFIVQSAQAKYTASATFLDYDTLEIYDLPVDGDTITIGGETHTFRTSPSLANDVLIGGTVDACVTNLVAAWAEHPLVTVIETGSGYINVRSKTRAVYTTSHTWATSGDAAWLVGQVSWFAVYSSSAFDALASDDDTCERYTGDHNGAYYKILDRTADALFVDSDNGWGDPGTTHNVIHFKRFPFVERTVDVASSTAARCAWTGTLGTSHGWNDDAPKRGDLYLVWATSTTADSPQEQNSNPESCPTVTQRNTTECWWPYGTPGPARRVPYVATYGNQHASEIGSQLNSYWCGTFLMPRESFLIGDRLTIRTVSDLQLWGNPVIVEVLVIPGFDPAADWHKGGGIIHLERLLNANGKMMWFQSPIITDCDINLGFNVEIEGQAGFVQTLSANESGTNASQQWTCTFSGMNNTMDPYRTVISGTGGGANTNATGFPFTRGPIAHISLTDVENWSGLPYPVTVLIKTDHPTLLNRPGYHGYYAGEPFSCTTGNGGSLMYHVGQGGSISGMQTNADGQYISPLPYGASWRVATVSAEYVPGGMF